MGGIAKKIFMILFALMIILIGIGIFISTIYDIRDIFNMSRVLMFNTKFIGLTGIAGIFNYYVSGLLGIIAANLFIFSGIDLMRGKSQGWKLLLWGLCLVIISILMSVIIAVFKLDQF